MLSMSARPALRAAKYTGQVQTVLRIFGNQFKGISSRYAVPIYRVRQAQKLSLIRLPKWLPATTLNSYTCHRSLHISSGCLQDQDIHNHSQDDDVMTGSHDQTSQTVIHYGCGGIASIEDLLYHTLSDEDGMLPDEKFLESLRVDHTLDLCYLIDTDDEVTKKTFEEPIAVKLGRPSTTEDERKELDPMDILVLLEREEKNWKMPEDQSDVTNSVRFTAWMKTIELAARNIESPLQVQEVADPGSTEEEEELCDILSPVISSDDIRRGSLSYRHGLKDTEERFRHFYDLFSRANILGWPNGVGREAMVHFLKAVVDVCTAHALQLEHGGVAPKNQIQIRVEGLGGAGTANEYNCRTALKALDKGIMNEDGTLALRNPLQWGGKVTQHCVGKKDRKIADGWFFRQHVPDVILQAKSRLPLKRENFKKIGLLVGETKSSNDSVVTAESQGVLQALQGLIQGPKSASLVMHPQCVMFVELSVEEGFVLKRSKQYNVIQNYAKKMGRQVTPSAYQELFRDLVVYLWNNYYQDQYSSLNKFVD